MSNQFIQPRVDRTQPRKIKRKKRLTKRIVGRTLVIALTITVAALIGRVVAAKIVRPFHLCGAEAGELRRVASELRALRRENAALECELRRLRTNQGIAPIARKLGFVKPGEITLIIPEDPPTPSRRKPSSF